MSKDNDVLDILVEKKFPECIVKNIDHTDDLFMNIAFEALHNFLSAGKHHKKSLATN